MSEKIGILPVIPVVTPLCTIVKVILFQITNSVMVWLLLWSNMCKMDKNVRLNDIFRQISTDSTNSTDISSIPDNSRRPSQAKLISRTKKKTVNLYRLGCEALGWVWLLLWFNVQNGQKFAYQWHFPANINRFYKFYRYKQYSW